MKKITKLFKERMFLILVLGLFTAGVQAQTAAVTGSTIGCIGDTKVLGVAITGPLSGSITYLWSNGATTSTISITATGFFRVAVSGTGPNGNQVTIQSPWRLFIFFPKPNATISANGPVQLCPGQSVTLTVAGEISSVLIFGITVQQLLQLLLTSLVHTTVQLPKHCQVVLQLVMIL